jgi:menaquinol-cytochrome c reductase cytochrome b subunit
VKLFKSLYHWLDDRLGLDHFLKINLLNKTVPNKINFGFCFGGISFFLFIMIFVTGCFMTMYYIPSIDHANDSVDYLMYEVPMGSTVRSIHYWSANLIIVTMLLHMVRVFIYGAYKKPKELNWMTGVLLFCLTLASAFTGQLLPWDQKGFWVTKVGTNIIRSTPLFGEYLYRVLIGSQIIGSLTLVRFYSIHIIFLPMLTVLLMLGHFMMIRRHGVSFDL